MVREASNWSEKPLISLVDVNETRKQDLPKYWGREGEGRAFKEE